MLKFPTSHVSGENGEQNMDIPSYIKPAHESPVINWNSIMYPRLMLEKLERKLTSVKVSSNKILPNMYHAMEKIRLNRVRFKMGTKEPAVLTSMSHTGFSMPYLHMPNSLKMANPRSTEVASSDSPKILPMTAVHVVIVTRKL